MDPYANIQELASRLSDAEKLAEAGDLESAACELFDCQMLVDGMGQWTGFRPSNAHLWPDLEERFDNLRWQLEAAGHSLS